MNKKEQAHHQRIFCSERLTRHNLLVIRFNEAIAIDQSLNTWNVSKVKDMSSIFSSAINFNQSLDAWNVYCTSIT